MDLGAGDLCDARRTGQVRKLEGLGYVVLAFGLGRGLHPINGARTRGFDTAIPQLALASWGFAAVEE
ncbi:hypothetical protein Asi03nite_40670 [Actinoplanes siamensis]|uniref:Uncharacterized protein n=1 Tax=Actinoplanes siamensis TaxID=1223317 RepID=A0A919N8P6_9ACTN|nr:hypothetical protein Asi03nite_40670 [Actinoplanes siamensis]